MEHIICTPIDEKLYKFTAEEGFRLYDKAGQCFRPEAITTMAIAKKQLEAVAEDWSKFQVCLTAMFLTLGNARLCRLPKQECSNEFGNALA